MYHTEVLNCGMEVCYYEMLAGMWVRNGHQIRGQAMTYIQSHFCKSTIDVDIYLLQVTTFYLFDYHVQLFTCVFDIIYDYTTLLDQKK